MRKRLSHFLGNIVGNLASALPAMLTRRDWKEDATSLVHTEPSQALEVAAPKVPQPQRIVRKSSLLHASMHIHDDLSHCPL
jgi:hypothetical protein